jgi:hypothetical protein
MKQCLYTRFLGFITEDSVTTASGGERPADRSDIVSMGMGNVVSLSYKYKTTLLIRK